MCLNRLLIIYFLFHYTDLGESKAVTSSSNRSMRYYVFPMSDWEAESLQRQARQQGASNTGSDNNGLAPAGTAINVVNIINGLFREDVRPILSGSTAFIPAGGLRDGVTGLLYGLAPALQQVLFGVNSNIPATDSTIPTAAPVPRTEPPTSPRPRRRRTTTTPPETTSVVPEDGSDEETEAPSEVSTPASPTLPPSSSIQPTATSAESDEETEAPPATNAPSATPASPQVSEPLTEKANAAIPESPQVQPVPQPTQPPSQPESASPSSSQVTPAPFNATQLKVVLEDANSIVTANVMNNVNGEEKQYIYLVLLPEQYEQFNKLTGTVQRDVESQSQSTPQQMETQPPSIQPKVQAPSIPLEVRTPSIPLEVQTPSIQPEVQAPSMQTKVQAPLIPLEVRTPSIPLEVQTPSAANVTEPPSKHVETKDQEEIMELHPAVATTVRSNRYKYSNKTRSTTIPPPHLQLQYYYQLTSTSTSSSTTTTTTTTTPKTTSSTDLPGVSGFENEDDELEN